MARSVKLPSGETIQERRVSNGNLFITNKWVLGGLCSILLLGGGAWATTLYAEVTQSSRHIAMLLAAHDRGIEDRKEILDYLLRIETELKQLAREVRR